LPRSCAKAVRIVLQRKGNCQCLQIVEEEGHNDSTSAPHGKPYPSDVSDEEWSLVVPYLTLMTEAAPQRDHSLRELFNALRYVIRYGIAWRAMPNDFPPWAAVYQQSQRWMAAERFEMLAQDLRALLRLASGRAEEPTAAIIDSRTLRSTPESGTRAGYDGAKRQRGSKVHMAVDTLGHLLALHVTPADVGDRMAVKRLVADIQDATGAMSSWPTSTRATPARRPLTLPQPRASRCTSSGCRRRSEALFSCPGAGWWK
jgi:transposase